MLNIGFIACGGIARHHASRLANVRGARIIACADGHPGGAGQSSRDADDERTLTEVGDGRAVRGRGG